MDELAKIRLDTHAHRAWLGDQPLRFAPMEFRLVTYLADNVGNVVTRAAILREVWGTDWPGGKSIDMHLAWIRRKLGDDVKNPRYITTVRGVGFRLEPGTVELVTQQQTGPDASVTRVVLVKRGDVLAFGNVGEVSERVEATAGALRDQLGLGAVLLFPGDIDMSAVTADRSKP